MNSMGKRRFNGLTKKLLNKILIMEEKRLGISAKEVSWEKFTGKHTDFSGFVDGLKDDGIIHVSQETKNYCHYVLTLRHELHHLKHTKLRMFLCKIVKRIQDATGLFLLRLFSWVYEFPADRYADYKFNETMFQSELCKRCPEHKKNETKKKAKQK